MIYQNSEINGRGTEPPLDCLDTRDRGGNPGKKRPNKTPEPKIDLERLVWDPEYRDQVRRILKR